MFSREEKFQHTAKDDWITSFKHIKVNENEFWE
jgi:hypothetical protein